MSSLLNHFSNYIGQAAGEPGPEDELPPSELHYNPVTMSSSMVPGKYMPAADEGVALAPEASSELDTMPAAMPDSDANGPVSDMPGQLKQDLQDFLALRMQARQKRSEAFQQKAISMAKSMA
jgi:hypothetical protein